MNNISSLFENLMTYNEINNQSNRPIVENDSTLLNLTVELPTEIEDIEPIVPNNVIKIGKNICIWLRIKFKVLLVLDSIFLKATKTTRIATARNTKFIISPILLLSDLKLSIKLQSNPIAIKVNKNGKIQRCDFVIFESRTRPFFEKWDCPFT